MSLIEKLTAEQEAMFGDYVERWTRIGLCTDPADRPKAEQAIRDAYRLGGRSEPDRIVWCGSPFGMALTRAIIQQHGASVRDPVGDSVKDPVGASVRDSVGDSVWASVMTSVGASVLDSVRDPVRDSVRDSVGASVMTSVWDSVMTSVRTSVRASVWDPVWDSVRNSVWASVLASVSASVRDSVWDPVRDSVRNSVGDSVYGQHDASWLSFYAFFREQCDLREQTDKLVGLTDLCQSAGWAIPHERICWVSERHNVCSLDDEQRIHNETGPAIAYPDGWAIWAHHGVRVPRRVIERPGTLTPAEILGEPNAEVRRVMMERFGPDRLLREANASLIDDEREFGKLWRLPVEGDEDLVMVEVVNSTAEPDGSFKDYWIRVPPSVGSAREAVAWTFDVPADEYAPAVQT